MKSRKKRYICGGLTLLCLYIMTISDIHSQNQHHNYVMTRTMLNEAGTMYTTSLQYLDGMGRPELYEENGYGTEGKYLCTRTEYDPSGRQSCIWLPAPCYSTPLYMSKSTYKNKSKTAFNGDAGAYSHIFYDALGRVVFRQTPGDQWHSGTKGLRTEYFTNSASSVKKYTFIPSDGSYSENGFHGEGTLYAERNTDADGHFTETYKDIRGNLLLERRGGKKVNGGDEEYADTYFIYDAMSRLRYVLPPMCQEHGTNSELYLYRYKYDRNGNCTERKLPGCAVVSMIYDSKNRLAYYRDGRMRDAGKYRFFLYDHLGRLAVQGMCSNDTIYSDTAANKNATVSMGASVGVQLGCTGYYLDETSYGLESPVLEIVNYYDNYDFMSTADFSAADSRFGLSDNTLMGTGTKSFSTGQAVAATNGEMLYRVFYYDDHGRMTDLRRTYPSGLYSHTQKTYTFTGKTKTEETSYSTNGTSLPFGRVGRSIAYAHERGYRSDSPVSQYLYYGNSGPSCFINYTYDSHGRVSGKDTGGVLSETHTYNLHGWPVQTTVTKSGAGQETVFSETLHYADGDGVRCYNGNISSLEYVSADTALTRLSTFKYDGYGRLVNSDFRLAGGGWIGRYYELFTYDKNGSLTTLLRAGKRTNGYGYTDALTCTYEGNRLKAVEDNISGMYTYGSGMTDFKDNYHSPVEYCYDKCGSLTQDRNKGICLVDYDLNGMPVRVQFKRGDVTEYIYGADGTKLRSIHRTSRTYLGVPDGTRHTLTPEQTLSVDSTSYAMDLEIDKYFSSKYYFGDGYINLGNTATGSYCYFAKDHLGSVRAVVGEDGAVKQVNNSYAYGAGLNDVVSGTDVQTHKYNGKELDRMHGMDWYDYGARQYDPTLGMFTSMDPFCEKYYHLSPYAYCGNDPVNRIDVNGDSIIYRTPNWKTMSWDVYHFDAERSYFCDSNGNQYTGTDNGLTSITNALTSLSSKPTGRKIVSSLAASSSNVLINIISKKRRNREAKGSEGYSSVVNWNPSCDAAFGGGSFVALGHELAHSYDRIFKEINTSTWYSVLNESNENVSIPKAEIFAMHYENLIRTEHSLPLRTHYSIDKDGNPDGGEIIKNGNQSIYFNFKGKHFIEYDEIVRFNYIYKK